MSFGLDNLHVSPEKASHRLLEVQQQLIEEGRYDVLSSFEYRDKVDEVTSKYGRAEQRRLKGDLVYSWLVDQENFIENRNGNNKKTSLNGMPRWKFNKYRTAEYATAQMNMIFGKIAEFQRTSDTKNLHEIEQSQLIQSSEGLLGLKKPSMLDEKSIQNSPIQQGRMFLLGIRGLSPTIASKVVEYVKLPPNTSRSIVGKLPAAIIRMGARLGLDWAYKANMGWPTPQDGGGTPLPHKDNEIIYKSALNIRLDHLKACIENGWELPNLNGYLPDETLKNREIMRSLVNVRREHRKKHPVSRWNPPYVRGDNGLIYSHTGVVVDETRSRNGINGSISVIESGPKARSLFKRSILVVALLGFFN